MQSNPIKWNNWNCFSFKATRHPCQLSFPPCFFVLVTDCSQSQQATTHPQAVSCSCDLVASDNLYSAGTAEPSHQLGWKRKIKSDLIWWVSNTREWQMAHSQKEQERETGLCQKSNEQRSQIHLKSPGVQPYSYQRKTEEK